MEMKLHDAEDRLKIMQESQHTYNEMHEVEIEISNWEYRIKRHKEYLQEMGELHKKLEEFDKSEWVKVLRVVAKSDEGYIEGIEGDNIYAVQWHPEIYDSDRFIRYFIDKIF
mgnify:CR=1 FL=1